MRTLTLQGASAGANTISGIIQDNLVSGTATGTAPVAVTKAGAGTWVLGGANTYSGPTTISVGKLSLGASDVLPDASAVVLAGGTLLTGSGFTEAAKSLSLTASSIITMGGLAGTTSTLTFSSAPADYGISPGITLSIWNWNGSSGGGGEDRLIVPAGSLSATQLTNISFYSGEGGAPLGGGGAAFASGGELVPVPEPTALQGAALLGAAIMFRRRVRQRAAAL